MRLELFDGSNTTTVYCDSTVQVMRRVSEGKRNHLYWLFPHTNENDRNILICLRKLGAKFVKPDLLEIK